MISFAADRENICREWQINIIIQIKDLDKHYASSPTPRLFREHLKLKTDFDLLSRKLYICYREIEVFFMNMGRRQGNSLRANYERLEPNRLLVACGLMMEKYQAMEMEKIWLKCNKF